MTELAKHWRIAGINMPQEDVELVDHKQNLKLARLHRDEATIVFEEMFAIIQERLRGVISKAGLPYIEEALLNAICHGNKNIIHRSVDIEMMIRETQTEVGKHIEWLFHFDDEGEVFDPQVSIALMKKKMQEFTEAIERGDKADVPDTGRGLYFLEYFYGSVDVSPLQKGKRVTVRGEKTLKKSS